jgi:hypothetical protein
LKSMKVNFNIFRGHRNHQILTSLNQSGQFCRLKWGKFPTSNISKATQRYFSRRMV